MKFSWFIFSIILHVTLSYTLLHKAIRPYHHLSRQELIDQLNEKQLLLKQKLKLQRNVDILRTYLANKTQSSFLKDFHTIRF